MALIMLILLCFIRVLPGPGGLRVARARGKLLVQEKTDQRLQLHVGETA